MAHQVPAEFRFCFKFPRTDQPRQAARTAAAPTWRRSSTGSRRSATGSARCSSQLPPRFGRRPARAAARLPRGRCPRASATPSSCATRCSSAPVPRRTRSLRAAPRAVAIDLVVMDTRGSHASQSLAFADVRARKPSLPVILRATAAQPLVRFVPHETWSDEPPVRRAVEPSRLARVDRRGQAALLLHARARRHVRARERLRVPRDGARGRGRRRAAAVARHACASSACSEGPRVRGIGDLPSSATAARRRRRGPVLDPRDRRDRRRAARPVRRGASIAALAARGGTRARYCTNHEARRRRPGSPGRRRPPGDESTPGTERARDEARAARWAALRRRAVACGGRARRAAFRPRAERRRRSVRARARRGVLDDDESRAPPTRSLPLPRRPARSRAAASTRASAAARSRASRSPAGSDLLGGRRVAEVGDHRRVIARADVAVRRRSARLVDERAVRGDVVEAPADVALAHVAPRRPPREQPIVVGIDVAADVDEAVREQLLDQRRAPAPICPIMSLRSDRVDVDRRARDVEVAAQDEVLAGGFERARPRDELVQELIFAAKSLPPFGT